MRIIPWAIALAASINSGIVNGPPRARIIPITSTKTWVAPGDVYGVDADCWGGGGAGGGGSNGAILVPNGPGGGGSGGSGGAASMSRRFFLSVIPGRTYTITIGAGGAKAANGGTGSPGGSNQGGVIGLPGGDTIFAETQGGTVLQRWSGGYGGATANNNTSSTFIYGSFGTSCAASSLALGMQTLSNGQNAPIESPVTYQACFGTLAVGASGTGGDSGDGTAHQVGGNVGAYGNGWDTGQGPWGAQGAFPALPALPHGGAADGATTGGGGGAGGFGGTNLWFDNNPPAVGGNGGDGGTNNGAGNGGDGADCAATNSGNGGAGGGGGGGAFSGSGIGMGHGGNGGAGCSGKCNLYFMSAL